MGSILLTAVLDIAGIVLVWFLLRRRIQKTLEIDGLLAEARKEARLLTIEINETTERNITLIEDRLGALRDLLGEADRRMGVMRRETGRRQVETEVYSRLGKRLPVASAAPQAGPERELSAAASRASSRMDAPAKADSRALQPELDIAEAEGRRESSPEVAQSEPVPLPLGPRLPEILAAPTSIIPPRSLRERAIELHRSGFSADIIAARLGATISEIELLVSLEEGRGGQEGQDGE
ncbi:MAG TPA: hypothetical protein VMV44_04615 [Rectinemataceae bacterium]|nr:hypothetical protein [Rectinemataceae bacterium]